MSTTVDTRIRFQKEEGTNPLPYHNMAGAVHLRKTNMKGQKDAKILESRLETKDMIRVHVGEVLRKGCHSERYSVHMKIRTSPTPYPHTAAHKHDCMTTIGHVQRSCKGRDIKGATHGHPLYP